MSHEMTAQEEREFRLKYPALWARWRKKLERRRKPGKRSVDKHRGDPWTQDEDTLLTGLWGLRNIDTIAKHLKRSAWGVHKRASRLGLAGPDGVVSLAGFARTSGYTRQTIRLAAKRLGIRLRRSVCMHPRHLKRTPNTHFAITARQQSILLQELLTRPERSQYRVLRRGEWRGRNPEYCGGCDTAERPHYAKNMCSRCYYKDRRKRRKRVRRK